MISRVLPIAAVAGLLAVPAAATVVAKPTSPALGARGLAALECRDDRFDDPAEFRFKYGAGPLALERCIRAEIREARFECRQDRVEDRFEFRAEYGTGRAAFSRCVRDKIS
jgi:hypothetical protein